MRKNKLRTEKAIKFVVIENKKSCLFDFIFDNDDLIILITINLFFII